MKALLALFLILGGAAQAHDWYTGLHNESGESCCSQNEDCAPDKDIADVQVRPGGYYIRSLDTFVPNKRAKPSLVDDGYYHICRWGGEVKCFFYPNHGS